MGMGKSQKRHQSAKPDPAQPSAKELKVRRTQREIDTKRAADEKEGRTSKVTQQEREFRTKQGNLMRARANTPGTHEYVNRQRQLGADESDEAI